MSEVEKVIADPHHEHKKRRVLLWIAAAFALLAVLVFLYYWFFLRNEEYTDDAYVGGNQVFIHSQISGFVTDILTDDNLIVDLGQVIVRLDTQDTEIALEAAKAELGDRVREVTALFQKVGALKAEQQMVKALMIRAGQDYMHRQNLVGDQAVSKEDFEHAEADFIAAVAKTIMIEYELKMVKAKIENTTIETHPLVQQGKEEVRRTWLDYHRCAIKAPARGMVAQRKVQVGQSIRPSDLLMAVVPFDQMWVNANFKENQLRHMRLGQSATLRADLYGGSVSYKGRVIGMPAGTGSIFSLIPPQNATGNWIKIVQRLPVRIGLDPEELKNHPLRLGLSMEVKVDIQDREGPMVPATSPQETIYGTDVFADQQQGVELLIQEIIDKNKTFSP